MKNCYLITFLEKLVLLILLFSPMLSHADNHPNLKLFGNLHISLDDQPGLSGPALRSNTSTIGLKGNNQLDSINIIAIFKMEWQVEITERNQEKSLVDRDQWIGLKGAFGKIIIGTATTNYKQTSAKIDPLWRTALEGRSSFMRISSRQLSAGAGNDRGRLTNSFNFTTEKFNGIHAVINATTSEEEKESYGIGIRSTGQHHLIFIDYFNDGDVNGNSETAIKIGAKYKADKWSISGQVEQSEDIDGADYWMLGASLRLNQSGALKATIGSASGDSRNSQSYAFIYDYKLSKNMNAYAGYGAIKDDASGTSDKVTATFGTRYLY